VRMVRLLDLEHGPVQVGLDLGLVPLHDHDQVLVRSSVTTSNAGHDRDTKRRDRRVRLSDASITAYTGSRAATRDRRAQADSLVGPDGIRARGPAPRPHPNTRGRTR